MSFILTLGLVIIAICTVSAGYRDSEADDPPGKVLVATLVALCAGLLIIFVSPTVSNQLFGCPSATGWFRGLPRDAPHVLLSAVKEGEYLYSLVYLKSDGKGFVVKCVWTSDPLPTIFSVGSDKGTIVSFESSPQK